MHARTCHACNQPIDPLSGCIGRFGDDDLRHYHTACFAGIAVAKPEPEPIARRCCRCRTLIPVGDEVEGKNIFGGTIHSHKKCCEEMLAKLAQSCEWKQIEDSFREYQAKEAEPAPADPEAVAPPKVFDPSPKKFAWFEKGEVVFTDTRRSSVFVGVIARDGGDTGALSRAIEEESIDCDMGFAAELACCILRRIAVDLETEDVAVAMVHEGKQVHSFKSGAFASPGWQSDLFDRHRGAKLTPQPCN